MKVLYYTPFFSGDCEPRFARMHDLWHFMSRNNLDFDCEILAATGINLQKQSPGEVNARVPLSFLDSLVSAEGIKGKSGGFLKFIKKPFLRRYLEKADFDVFHPIAHTSFLRSLLPWLEKEEIKTVLGPNLLGYFPQRRGSRWDLNEANLKERIKKKKEYRLKKEVVNGESVDQLLALGRYHKQLLDGILETEKKIELLTPAVDPKFFGPSGEKYETEADFVVLYVGKFTQYKGIDVFLEALELLKQETDINFKAVLCGSGPYNPLTNHPNLKENLDIRGYVPRENIAKYYRGADVYVHPSIDEVGAGTMIESLACGTPCIATDRLGFREYDFQNVCRFFEPRNSNHLREKLKSFYERKYEKVKVKSLDYLLDNKLVKEIQQIYQGL